MAQKALLVGINAYPKGALAGCVNDIVDMAAFLTSKYGFPQESIRLLADERATASAILERLNWLVDGVKAGDQLVFHYSGHGVQVASRAGSGEIDKLDEAICPVNFDWTDETMIKDKQFHEIFEKVPAGVKFMWVNDSCHSGDLSRDLSRWNNRAMPVPVDIQWKLNIARSKAMTAKKELSDLNQVVLISGCKSNQTSADATFNNRPNGALTYYLLQALQAKNGLNVPLPNLVTKVRKALRETGYEQIPQLEGPVDLVQKSFLG